MSKQTPPDPSKSGHIYLIQTPEFIKSGEPVYKIGKTAQKNNRRFYGYPPGTRLLVQLSCDDCKICEDELLAIFKTEFKLYRGNEWFEGDCKKMQDLIHEVVRRNNVAEKLAAVSIEEEKVRPLEKQGAAGNARKIFFETRTQENYHMLPPGPHPLPYASHPLSNVSPAPDTYKFQNDSVFEDQTTRKLNGEIKTGRATRKFMPNTIESYTKLHPRIVGFDFVGDSFYAIFLEDSRKIPTAFDIDDPRNIEYLKKFPQIPVFLVTNVTHPESNAPELLSQTQLLKKFKVELPDLFAFKIRSGGLWFGTVYEVRKFDQISVDIDALLDDIRELAKEK